MPEIPSEIYAIIGTLVVTKFESIMGFFKAKVAAEVRVSTIETTIQNLSIQLGEIKAKQEKYQQDLNEYFRKLRIDK